MDSPKKHFSTFKLGKEDGLKHYMRVLGPSLRYFAFGFVKNKQLAEEIVSDSFVKLWQGKEKIGNESSISAFLYISTKNACLDQLDLLHNRAVHNQEELAFIENPSEDILTKMIQTELIKLIAAQADKLPSLQAKIFKMTFFEQMETEEICAELGKSSNSIYFARSKALIAIKKALGLKYPFTYHNG